MINHELLSDFEINEAAIVNNQVLSYNSLTNRIVNSVSFNESPIASTLALRDSSGCLKVADPVFDGDAVNKATMVSYISNNLNSTIFQDSSTVNFSTDSGTGKMYADVTPVGNDGSIQVKKTVASVPTLSASTYISEDYVNGYVKIVRDNMPTTNNAMLHIAKNNNTGNKVDLALESIQSNILLCPDFSTYTHRNLSSTGTISKAAISANQLIYSQNHYAAINSASTVRAGGIKLISDSDWSTATKKCHFEISQRNGSNDTVILRTSAEGDFLTTYAVKIGAISGTPVAGMLQWNGNNFQGYKGSSWVNMDTTVARYDNVTVEDDATEGFRVKNGGLTLAKFNSSAIQSYGGGNTKLTTVNYVDSIASYSETAFTNQSILTITHNKGRFMIPEVYVLNGNGKYVAGAGQVEWSTDKNSITITFGAQYSGYYVIRG